MPLPPDGTRLVVREDRPRTGNDLMLLTLDSDRRVTPLIETRFNEGNALSRPSRNKES